MEVEVDMAPQGVNGGEGESDGDGGKLAERSEFFDQAVKKKKKTKKKKEKKNEEDKLSASEARLESRETIIRRMAKKQASLDEITSRPYFNERKANKIAQTLTNASKQLQILDKDLSHNLEMTTGQVNEEEGRQLNDLVLEPVMKESRLRKRKFDQGSKKIQDVGDDPLKHTGNKTIVSEDTSKKAKKKRIKKKLSEDSFAGLDFFPVFPQDVPHGSRHCATNDPTSNGSVIPNHPMGTRNVPGGPPTPEQIRNDALLATITNACSHPAGDDHRLDARVASVTTAKKSPATLYHEKLIAVGQAALKVATYPARSDLPLSRSADVLPLLKAAAAQHAHHASAIIPSKPIALDQHVCKESPVPPPKRTFSARARFDPGTKPIIARKGNELDFPKAAGHTQADFSSSRTTTALKEAGSATVIGGLFTPSDPSTTNVPTGLTPKRPRTLSSPDEINFSPSASGASRSNPRREEEDWEVESGRLRARVDAEGTSDDGEAEENIAFSSAYLCSRPLGISISGNKFQVLSIVAGTEQDVPTHLSKGGTKICSVAKGRVKVDVGGKKFAISEGGMWRLRAGQKCLVANQLGSQGIAAVHVFTSNS